MKKNNSFTLMELMIVVVILGILAAMAIPIYTRTVEEQRGRVCNLNMISIFAAWRIYNMNNPGSPHDPDGVFQDVSTINTTLRTLIDERYFGLSGTGAGFYMDLDAANNLLRIRADRLSGTYSGNTIACDYNYTTGAFNWDPVVFPWDTTWSLSLCE